LFFVFTARKGISVKSLQILTVLSVVRVPVELVLLWLYQHGQVPQLMTFEGRNFDILSGLTAPLVAWLGFCGGKINRALLIIWNLFALGLLLNIVTTAILSLETPFQQFAFDQRIAEFCIFPLFGCQRLLFLSCLSVTLLVYGNYQNVFKRANHTF
jgi:hypothetical protein